MKRKLLFISILLIYGAGNAQIIPTGGGQGTNSIEYWSRSGNNQGGNNNNIFGTKWNSPIYTVTGGISAAHVRMKLNGDNSSGQYSINSYTSGFNTSGYMGLGYNSELLTTGQYLWSNKGAYSLLHLNGRNGTFVQEGGFRPWMQAGVTFTDNQDLSYIGIRRVGSIFDVSEMTIAWSDNTGSSNGPDDLSFRFLGEGNGNTTINTGDLLTTSDLDGLHIARFAPTGEFGLGNTFGVNPTGTPANLYVRPASLAHYSLSNLRSVWQQFTNRNTTTGSGTGETDSDGLRIGVIGHTNANVNGTAAMYNQETRALLFSTNANTNAMDVLNGTTLERMRIMSVGTPTHLASGGFGTYNPGGIATNITRVAISHNPSQPVTRPLSLLHLGYNNNGTGVNGWRPWMDIGSYTSNGTDNMYVGLKVEGTDRADAVVSWGDNQTSPSSQGPDYLRFIFTSTAGDAVSSSANGLEIARMHPGKASTLPTNNFGMVGIGNFTTNSIDAKLDIDGDLRIRTVEQDNSLTKVLVIDPDDLNRVHWRDVNSISGNANIQANNGSSISATDHVVFGQNFQETGDPAQLLNDREVPMRGHNILFTDEGRVGIGDAFSNPTLTPVAKLDIRPSVTDEKGINAFVSGNFSTHPYYEMNTLTNNTIGTIETTGVGIYMGGSSDKRSTGLLIENESETGSAFGIESIVNGTGAPNQTNTAGLFNASGISLTNTGISVGASEASSGNTAGLFRAGNPTPDGQNGVLNIGISTNSISGQTSVGIMATATGGTVNNYAGHFTGDIYANGVIVSTSDQNLKENIQGLTNVDSILNALNPVTFSYKQTGIYERMNMPENQQFGLIAQEVEPLLPTLIKDGFYPAEYDSLGNEIAAAIEFKTMNYEGLIPILVKGHQEQATKIDSLQSMNDSLQIQLTDLNNRLTQLENCLSGILPLLCHLSNSRVEQTEEEVQQKLLTAIDVYLSNGTAIVLNQNVPNPFAESTTITFSIPESIQEAQIIFHDAKGSLIKMVDIRERGDGQINVYANDLSTGVYTYSLVADGKIVATKRMVKQ